MKNKTSYIRIIVLVAVAYFLIEYALPVEGGSAFSEYPITWLILFVAGILALAVELSVAALQNVLYRSLSEEEKERYNLAKQAEEEKRWAWFNKIYHKILDKKPMSSESEIVLDHNYDGIKELDNNLPPWWIYGFYLTIVFAIVYLARFHVFNDYNQLEEYETEVAKAELAITEYKKTAKDLVDINTVEFLDNPTDLGAGKSIFQANCIACHKADGGGGIGPNLTDEYWILGGGIKNIFKVISEGGRSGKGMVAWDQTLKPLERAQVASYVLSLQGTTPAEPKEPQGDLWVDENATGGENAPEAEAAIEEDTTSEGDTEMIESEEVVEE
ncbi:MAG: cbb3-type cytochrome c oxidase N-terminal domain-containing protein [Mesonia hippocampi]|uniref:cbb3-type cytochrome c oxidase N-terminal domain-containing protein n=1 Tax=Mesonia hippocampi TaxID=1628250 RepID=UPI003F963BA1